MGPLTSCSFVLAAALCWMSLAQGVGQYIAAANPVHIFPALQTHMPTRHGNVSHIQPQEQTEAIAQSKIKPDTVELQRESRELLELSQSLQADIESVNKGLMPKDTIDKLKRIQKLAKHLKGELEP
ncbi:MAG: hypothetical protein ACRD3L_01310 [Terriglobales bacterium]